MFAKMMGPELVIWARGFESYLFWVIPGQLFISPYAVVNVGTG